MRNYKKITRPEMERLIDDWIFHERNRKIVKRKLLDGLTFEEVSVEFELSVRQVKNIVYKALDILCVKM